MRNIKLLCCILCFGIISCTKQEVIDTGTASAHFNGNMMQYLQSDDYNWKLTVQMIKRAGLTDLFEGKIDTLKEITFFGPTNYSILRYLYDNGMDSVAQLTPQFCREMILKHVVKGKYLKETFKMRDKQYYVNDPHQTGYTQLTTLEGNVLRAYLEKTDYQNISDAGPVIMYLFSMTKEIQVPVASPDIQPSNGVVHSLNYNYTLGSI